MQRGRKPNDALAAIYTKAPPARRSFAQRWSVWAAGYGGSQTTDGNAARRIEHHDSAASTAPRSAPTIASRPIRSRALRWPAAAPISPSPTAAAAAPTCSRPARSCATTLVPAYLSGALAYGWQDVTTDRTVTVAGIDQSARASSTPMPFPAASKAAIASSRRSWAARHHALRGGAVHHLRSARLCRKRAVRRQHVCAELRRQERHRYPQRTRLPHRQILGAADAILTLRGRVAWAHDFNPDRNIAATFQTLPGASFVVNGAAQASTPRSSPPSAEMKWLNGFSVAATFEGEFSDVTELRRQGRGALRLVIVHVCGSPISPFRGGISHGRVDAVARQSLAGHSSETDRARRVVQPGVEPDGLDREPQTEANSRSSIRCRRPTSSRRFAEYMCNMRNI